MENYISRPFLCEKEHIGKTHKVVWGTSSQVFHIIKIERFITKNITPHIISWRQRDGKVEISATCGVLGCGCYYAKETENLIIKEVRKYTFTIREWNALVKFKDTGFEI